VFCGEEFVFRDISFSIIELQSSVFLTKESRSLLIISIASFEVIDSGHCEFWYKKQKQNIKTAKA
ncbi:hypothetical protein BpHYR1_016216, partial [Brachionus plicatilis]